MNTEKTGGSAFPTALNDNTVFRDNHKTYNDVDGMTLLDYFAAKFAAAEIGNNSSGIATSYDDKLNIAREAYGQAAAMLEIRKGYINQ
jgi:hypothetical protein